MSGRSREIDFVMGKTSAVVDTGLEFVSRECLDVARVSFVEIAGNDIDVSVEGCSG
jgi:hypothetical protein